MNSSRGIRFGVCLPNYGSTFDGDGFLTFAKKAEELGFDSVWSTDHILMSAKSGTPYERILDSITALAGVATVTRRVRLGVSSLVMAMRNPVVVAKQLCTLDVLSGGRTMLATGAGWNEREFKNLGGDFRHRGVRLDESISLIRLLWGSNGDPVDFEGKRLSNQIENGVFSPPPVQKKLEIWVAGASEKAMERAAKLGDAWHPNLQPLEKFSRSVSLFRSIPGGSSKPICVRVAYNPDYTENEYVSPQGERRVVLSGNVKDNESILEQIQNLGVSYVLLAPDPLGNLSVPRQIDGLQKFASSFIER
jgi:probable F420-dependent oxidoreductase